MIYTTHQNIFRIGVGPSSSHTLGPMKAARDFAIKLVQKNLLKQTSSIICQLQGSLAATGVGHQTPNAIMAGLMGYKPDNYSKKCAPFVYEDLTKSVTTNHQTTIKLPLLYAVKKYHNLIHPISFTKESFIFKPDIINDRHTNSLVLQAYNADETLIYSKTYLSPGGGSVLVYSKKNNDYSSLDSVNKTLSQSNTNAYTNFNDLKKYQFANSEDLVNICEKYELSIEDIARIYEEVNNDYQTFDQEVLNKQLDLIWYSMNNCIEQGLDDSNLENIVLPGGLGLRKRAPQMYEHAKALKRKGKPSRTVFLSAFALAVNEQNAVGEQIVTAPTAGASGVIPSVLRFWIENEFDKGFINNHKKLPLIRTFLLTAAVIGSIIKANGSISGAEAGCQAEIGSACAMAAAGLTAISGGSAAQIENAAEIALEYHFGLTCDPVRGLVLIPCIERNAMAANTAVTASTIALAGNGSHIVSLDTAIKTMKQTGIDMNEAYKETAKAGLATNVAC